MKIVYLFFSFTRLAGTERILIDKMNYLADHMGHDVTVITYEQGAHPFVFPLSKNVNRIDLDTRFFTLYKFNLFKRIWLTLRMRKVFYKRYDDTINLIQPDVVLCTTYRDFEIKAVAKCHTKAKKIIESHINKTNVLLIGNEKIIESKIQLIVSKWREYFMMRNISRFDCLVALTSQDAKDWSPIVRTVVIPNFVDMTYTQQSDVSFKRAIAVGRYSWQKGFDLLINAWELVHKRYPEWKLDIYGGGDNGSYQKLADDKNLSSVVICHPAVKDISEKYIGSSMFVLSSRYEGFGLVLVEAMGAGLPVVSFACPCGPRDIIEEGECGILVESGNVNQLADSICSLIENESLRKSMGKEAVKRAKTFTKEDIMPKWISLFESL